MLALLCLPLQAAVTLTCLPSPLVLPCGSDLSPAGLGQPTATSDCGPVTLALSDSFPAIGTLERTWIATDGCGGFATCTQIVTFTGPSIVCPPDITIPCGVAPHPDNTGRPTAAEGCELRSISHMDISKTPIPFGCEILRRWTATDLAGNTATCDQIIRITGFDITTGTAAADHLRAIAETPDGSLLGGYHSDFLVSRLDRAGTVLWSKTFGAGELHAIVPTPGGYILAGSPGRATKIDLDGTVIWDKTYSPATPIHAADPTSDGGAILGGGDTVIKLAGDGSETWRATSTISPIRAVRETTGGYIIGGGSADYQVSRLDSAGAPIWTQSYGGDSFDLLHDLLPAAGGGFYAGGARLGGSASPGGDDIRRTPALGGLDFWLLKIDGSGNLLWDRAYGTNGSDELKAIRSMPDGNLLLGGFSDPGNIDFHLIKIDPTGLPLWERTFGGVTIDRLRDLLVTADGCIIAAGSTGSDEADFRAISLSECGCPLDDQQAQPITIDCPADKTIECGSSDHPDATGWASAAGHIDLSYQDSRPPGDACGLILRTWIARGPCGTIVTCDQRITVIDTTPPSLFCPKDRTLACHESTHPDHTEWATATDNCGPPAIDYIDIPVPNSNHCIEFIRRWRAIDCGDNTTICEQRITVIDTDAPVMTCPPDLSVGCGDSLHPDDTGWATATDCEVTITFADIAKLPHPDGCEVRRRWTATDACGNTAFCIQTIIIAQWDREYGTTAAEDRLRALIPTGDGYLLGGWSDDTRRVIRTNDKGDPIWDRNYGPGEIHAICPVPGGYILVGANAATKIDGVGNILWDSPIPAALAADSTPDGGCIITGTDILIKLAADGSEDFRKIISGAWRAVRSTSGGFLLGGGEADFEILRLDASGAPIWTQSYGGDSFDLLHDLLPAAGGGFYAGGARVGGSASPGGDDIRRTPALGGLDFWLLKIDGSGNLLWDRAYGTNGSDELKAIRQGADGTLTLGGFTDDGAADSPDFLILTTLPDGSLIGEKRIPAGDRLRDLRLLPDGCIAAAGESQSPLSDWYLVVYGDCPCSDQQQLGIDCPIDVTIECGSSEHPDTTGWATAPTGTISYSDQLLDGQGCGTIVRTWSVFDDCGNSATCEQRIFIVDTTPPEITCPPDIIVSCNEPIHPGNTGVATATDNCGPPAIDYIDIPVPNSNHCIEFIRRWRAIDCGDNTTICEQRITVIDTDAPVMTCPPDLSVGCGDSLHPDDTGWATATDCEVTITFADIAKLPHPDGCEVRRRWTATDACGNTAFCIQTIIIAQWDREYGTTAAEDRLRALIPTGDGYLLGGWSDDTRRVIRTNDKGDPIWDRNYGPGEIHAICPVPGGYILVGANAATKIDGVGNILWDSPIPAALAADSTPDGGCIITGTDILIKLAADGSEDFRKIISGAWRAVRSTSGGFLLGGGEADFEILRLDASGAPIWTQSYGGDSFDLLHDLLPAAGGGFYAGGARVGGSASPGGDDIRRTPALGGLDFWLLKIDGSGNLLWDRAYGTNGSDELKAIRQGADGTLTLGGFTDDGAADSPDFLILTTLPDGSLIGEKRIPAGDRLRDLRLLPDGCIAAAGESQSPLSDWYLVVYGDCPCSDQQQLGIDCPIDVTIECGSSEHPDTTGWATAPTGTISYSDQLLDGQGCGTIVRTWSVFDDCGNSATCEQRIFIVDTTPPEITCPPDIIVSCNEPIHPGNTGVATASDNCGPPSLSFSDGSDNGVIYRTWTATDCGGNTAQCSQQILVRDINPPTLIGLPAWTVLDVPDCNSVPTPPTVIATDDCDPGVTVQLVTLGECALITWTWSATDSSGNTVSATVRIRVAGQVPVAVADSYTGAEDTTITGNIFDNDQDLDGSAPTLLANSAKGTLTLSTDGSFSYQPNPNYHGPDSFSYQVGPSDTVEVSLTVSAVDDPPSVSHFSASDPNDLKPNVSIGRDLSVLLVGSDPDGDAITGWLISDSDTPPAANDPRWKASEPSAHQLPDAEGVHELYAYLRDSSGQVSAGLRRSIELAYIRQLDIRFTNASPDRLTLGEWPYATTGIDDQLDIELTARSGNVYFRNAEGRRFRADLRPPLTRNRWLLIVEPDDSPIEIQPIATGFDDRRLLIQRLVDGQPVGRAHSIIANSANPILSVSAPSVFSIVLAPEEEADLALASGWTLAGFNLLTTAASLPSDVTIWTWKDGQFRRVRRADIVAGAAYWIYSPGGSDVTLSGVQSSGNIVLDAGWSLVSPSADLTVPNIPGLIVLAWDTAADSYTRLATGDTMRANTGYWVFAPRNMELQVDE